MDWETGQDPLGKGPLDPRSQVATPAANATIPDPTPHRADRAGWGAGAAATDPPLDLKRRLYFLSGFDPRGASFYGRLFSQEVERRNATGPTGDRQVIQRIRPRPERDRLLSRWRIGPPQAPQAGPSTGKPDLAGEPPRLGQNHRDQGPSLPDPTSHEIGFLHWDDIARSHWPRRSLAMVGEIAEVYRWYLLQGGLLRIGRLCPGVALCGAYPALFTALAVLVALLAGAGLGKLVFGMAPGPGLALVAAVLVALGTTWLLLLAAWALADRLGVVWLWRSKPKHRPNRCCWWAIAPARL